MADSGATIAAQRLLQAEDIRLIALGAAILGSGGGGSTYLGSLLALRALAPGQSIPLIPREALPPEALALTVAQIGAPMVLIERLAQGAEGVRACEVLEAKLGRKAAAMVCHEIGGINGLIPVIAAARRGLPLVDADTMGRAFPGLDQDTLSITCRAPSLVAMCDEEGNCATVQAADTAAMERLGRALTTAMGGLAYLARPLLHAGEADRRLIPGSYSRALSIGRALRAALYRRDLRSIQLAEVGGRLLFAGSVRAVERPAPDNPLKGMLVVSGQGNGYHGVLRLAFQTEYLLAWLEGELQAATPDAISVIDEETGEPIETEALCEGQHVLVLHLTAHPHITDARSLDRVGPRAFGYAVAYRPWVENTLR
jgi:DUF917 family protein